MLLARCGVSGGDTDYVYMPYYTITFIKRKLYLRNKNTHCFGKLIVIFNIV